MDFPKNSVCKFNCNVNVSCDIFIVSEKCRKVTREALKETLAGSRQGVSMDACLALRSEAKQRLMWKKKNT